MSGRWRQRPWLALAAGLVVVAGLGVALATLIGRASRLVTDLHLHETLLAAADSLHALQLEADAGASSTGNDWDRLVARVRHHLHRLEHDGYRGLDLVHQVDALLTRAGQARSAPPGQGLDGPDPAQLVRRAAEELESARRDSVSLLRTHLAALRAQVSRLRLLGLAGAACALAGLLLAVRRRDGGTADLNPLLAAAVRSTTEGILITDFGPADSAATIVFVNRAFCHLIGRSGDDLLGRPLRVLAEDHLRRHDLSMLSSAAADRGSFTIETTTRREDGANVHCEWHVSPVFGRGQRITHIVSALRDISERKRQQEALLRSAEQVRLAHEELRAQQDARIEAEKMAYLGQLATGVAHEINNPIGFAMSGVEALAEDLPLLRRHLDLLHRLAATVARGETARAMRLVDEVDAHAERHQVPLRAAELESIAADAHDGLARARDIIEDLKAFARPLPTPPTALDLNRLVEDALRQVEERLADRIRTTVRLGELPPLVGRADQLHQVVTNLFLNSVQAIPASGRLTVTTTATATHAVLQVSDTGVGIPADHLPRIFTPFFTTRPAGAGTGLGLAIVYGYVRNHDGTIEVDSEPGRGTTFTVRLPVRSPGPAEQDR